MANIKYEYKVARLQPAFAAEKMNEFAKEGFRVVHASMFDGKLIVVMEKEKKGPGRPPKKAE